ncbi:MAG: thermonuclease family protein [Cyanobacteria bacterium P01_H01_bin.150]
MWKIANASALLVGLGLIVYGCRVLGDKQVSQTIDVAQNSVTEAPPIDWEIVKPAYDGDTITVKRNGEKLKVRFACIDAPELKQPMGKKSRDYLRSLISSSGGKVGLNVIKSDRYGRSVAEVWINTPKAGIELVQSLMVVTGNAYPYEQYKSDCPSWDAVKASQEYAKSNRIGVWDGEYVEPWEYRKGNR